MSVASLAEMVSSASEAPMCAVPRWVSRAARARAVASSSPISGTSRSVGRRLARAP